MKKTTAQQQKGNKTQYFLQAHFLSFCITILNISQHIYQLTPL